MSSDEPRVIYTSIARRRRRLPGRDAVVVLCLLIVLVILAVLALS
jgi:hypothetical protein